MNNAVWIWYPGDFEIYHGMRQNFRREERGMEWPAFWKMDDWRKNVRFFRRYELTQPETFTVFGCGVGHVQADGQKYPLGRPVTLPAGEHLIEVFIGNSTGLPCIYVESNREKNNGEYTVNGSISGDTVNESIPGDTADGSLPGDITNGSIQSDSANGSIHSDSTWGVDDFLTAVPAGTSSLCTQKEQDPNEIEYEEICVQPRSVTEKDGGALVDFGRMVDGRPVITFCAGEEARENSGEVCRESADKARRDEESVNKAFREEGSGEKEDRELCSKGFDERTFTILYGESRDEALDPVFCYYKEENATAGKELRKRAFRFIYLPGIAPEEISVCAVHQRVPIRVRAAFTCDDEMVNRIWKVSAETYGLCSGLFFIDGIKRDRWIWSGDAYQSMMINPYLYFDKEIDKRTSRALRGNTEIRQHINTIVDYTMLWLISIQNEYMMDADLAYVREMYPKMEAAMDLLFSQTDRHGFVRGRDRDWIYIDWADIDKDGCISAEQVLLWKCCKVMADCAGLLAEGSRAEYDSKSCLTDSDGEEFDSAGLLSECGREESDFAKKKCSNAGDVQSPACDIDEMYNVPALGPDGRPLPADHVEPFDAPLPAADRTRLLRRAAFYEEKAEALRQAILEFYWDGEKGALIDSFTSGRRNVTRHANIFAVLFDFADEDRKEQIRRNVLYNEKVPQITTPYFKFFELDALGKLGDLDRIWETIHDYWGGMIERGAVTFWELFDPKQEGREQYGMYGDPFGKSLCHAWGASPIYLLGKYFLGVRPTSPGYKTYEVKPAVQYFEKLDCTVPVGEKSVHIELNDGNLTVSECSGSEISAAAGREAQKGQRTWL